MTKERTIYFLMPIDKVCGAICGIILAINVMSCIIISLYIAPATRNLYKLHEEDKIIFKTDERWVKTYSGFTDFDWKEFLNTLKPKEKPVETDKKQEEAPKVEEVEQE
jgi:hypothetical protein